MKRRGFLMTEALLSLGILALVCVAAFPLIGRVGELVTTLQRRMRCREDALFSAQYATEAARFALARTTATETTAANSYSFKRKSDNYGIQTFGFSVSGGVLRFDVYLGGSQPLTGDLASRPEYLVRQYEGAAFFTTHPGGLLQLSYQVVHRESDYAFLVKTAVLPLHDFLLVGDCFE